MEGTSSLLSKCASGTTNFYDVKQTSSLSGVFNAIAQNLATLRITR
jgi:hypothetical protein